jgi:cell division GTPase FtsZ
MKRDSSVESALKFSILGIGNAGSQVAALAHTKLNLDAMSINTSVQDASNVPDITTVIIGPGDGAAKDRDNAKSLFKENFNKFSEDEDIAALNNADVVFVVGSTGGGTGSGLAPVVIKTLKTIYPEVIYMYIGILPLASESMSSKANTLECLKEVTQVLKNTCYMLYDNSKVAGYVNRAAEQVNGDIVKDIEILTGAYQVQTELAAMDKEEWKGLFNTAGRLVVFSIFDGIGQSEISTKDQLDQVLKDSLSTTTSVFNVRGDAGENQAERLGIITHLDEKIANMFDLSIISKAFYQPVEMFQHVSITNGEFPDPAINIIAAGLNYPAMEINEIDKAVRVYIAGLKAKQNTFKGTDLQAIKDKKKLIRNEMPKDPKDLVVDKEDIFEGLF